MEFTRRLEKEVRIVEDYFKNNQKDKWWYGCCQPRAPYPNYSIDIQSLVAIRVMGWMQADYDVVGNLFWSTDFYSKKLDTSRGGSVPLEDYYSTPNRFPQTNGDAKYVPEDVLSVKLQLTKGTTTGSKKTDMRLITSVDSTRYQLVGFAVTAKVTVDGDEKNQTKKYEQSTCYSTLNGAGLTYYPREFHDASESFITSLLKDMPISGTDLNKEITITPYWKTMDGTTYYGVSRTITKQQALDAAAAAS